MTEIRKDELKQIYDKDGLSACLMETKNVREVDICKGFGAEFDEDDINHLKDLASVTKRHIDSLKKKKPEIIKDTYEGDINVTKMYYEGLESVLYNAEKVIEKIEKRESSLKGWTVLMQRQPDITKEMIALMSGPHLLDREYAYEKIVERHEDISVGFLGELSYDVRMWKYKRM